MLDKEISDYESENDHREGSRRLFYLALPPSVYPSVCRMIRLCCMNKCMFLELSQVIVSCGDVFFWENDLLFHNCK